MDMTVILVTWPGPLGKVCFNFQSGFNENDVWKCWRRTTGAGALYALWAQWEFGSGELTRILNMFISYLWLAIWLRHIESSPLSQEDNTVNKKDHFKEGCNASLFCFNYKHSEQIIEKYIKSNAQESIQLNCSFWQRHRSGKEHKHKDGTTIKAQVEMSNCMTKPTIDLCAQWRLRSAWASVQSDQSLRCPHEESLGP